MRGIIKLAIILLIMYFIFGWAAWAFKKVAFLGIILGGVYIVYRWFFAKK